MSSPSFGHVFVILGENEALPELNSSNAPYMVKTLKPESAWFTDYHAVVPTSQHGASLAEYVALTSGQYAPCETSGPCGMQAVPSIFSQVSNGGWKDWNESMPSDCYLRKAGSKSTLNAYKPGHNPALFFAGLPCSTSDVPAGTTGRDDMSYFNNALAAGTVPQFNFISPNLCEDGHDSCHGANQVTEYDNFLRKEIPLIEASPAFSTDGVIFVTFDEGDIDTNNSNVMMAVLGPQVQAGIYSGHYDHYSTLATIEQGFGLRCLANACGASDLPVLPSSSQNNAATSCPAVPSGVTEYSGNVSVESNQTGWSGRYSSNSTVTRAEPPGGSYGGHWALRVGISSGSGQGGVTNAKPRWVSSTAKGGNYTASAFIRASAAGEKVYIALREGTSAGKTVGSSTRSLSLKDTKWHEVSDSYTAQGTGNVLHYSLHAHLASTSQHFLADCLRLESR